MSDRHKLGLDMSQSAGFDAVLHTPGLAIGAGATSENNTWMMLPVKTDYWEMINAARSVVMSKKQQTLHARLGFMNWGHVR